MNGADHGTVPLLADVSLSLDLLLWLGVVCFWAIATAFLWRRAWQQPKRLTRATDVLGALVCAGVLTFGLVRGAPEEPKGFWKTDQGLQMQAGFLDACGQGYYGRFSCRCLFARLTSRPDATTASDFNTLTQSIRYARLRGDPRWMRGRAAAATEACRRDA